MKKFGVSFEEFDSIMARAHALSPTAESCMTEMLLEGYDGTAMQQKMSGLADGEVIDAAHTRKAGPGKDGTGLDEHRTGNEIPLYHKAEEMPESDFLRMLTI